MSSGGPKMIKMSYGVAVIGLKWKKITKCPVNHDGRRSCFAGLIPARPTAVGPEILSA